MYGSARLWICVLVLLALVWWPGGIVEAREQSAALNGTVEAGKTYAVRLRNLPKGAVLAIKLKTSDSVVVWLLSEDSFKKFPSVEKPGQARVLAPDPRIQPLFHCAGQ
jgi:hypothetical protein